MISLTDERKAGFDTTRADVDNSQDSGWPTGFAVKLGLADLPFNRTDEVSATEWAIKRARLLG